MAATLQSRIPNLCDSYLFVRFNFQATKKRAIISVKNQAILESIILNEEGEVDLHQKPMLELTI